ncbi:GMC oxidoreductase [Daedalea quercina L-15889]|uniref:GMC oxidoreductase n=1 Tax=Daedalea quercina L-15889 TaxID=1314783 RepID=A0A165M9L6_9APHY|nr:GMC oxidoreductase [Daedalea quercina L-15889]
MTSISDVLSVFVDRLLPSPKELTAMWRAAVILTGTTIALGALTVALRHPFFRQKTHKFADVSKIARNLTRTTGARGGNQQNYDVIIVGGGTAGCVLASRLSENPSVHVLLLENGSSALDSALSQIPAMFPRNFHSEYDYEFHTVPQEHVGMKRKFWPRGKALGGCSSINAMMFHHGAPSDFDKWAELQKGREGASSWKYENFSRYLRKFEKYEPSREHPSVTTSLRGSNGPMLTGHFGHRSEGAVRFQEACVQAGLSFNPDFNTAKGTLGVNSVLTFIDRRGRRVSTESAYLPAEVLARENLTIAIGVRATRIIFEQVKGKTPRAVGVHFRDEHGDTFEVTARREIVLSAGAVHTPQILMLSGIGPATHISSHLIPVVVDLPGVGSHLMDHPTIGYHFRDRTKSLLAGMSHDPSAHGRFSLSARLWQLGLATQYRMTGRGPLTTVILEGIAFARSSNTSLFAQAGITLPVPDHLEDSTTGLDAPDIEMAFSPFTWLEHTAGIFPEGHHFALHTVLLRPTSTGTIRLSSANPSDPPFIDPQYLSTGHDVDVLVRGARLLGAILRQSPLVDMIDPSGSTDTTGLLNHDLASKSDAEIEALIRDRIETIYHPSCTARMAPLEDGGVVDPFLRVYGVEGLRVCDASVFPTITSGHTASPTIAVAEKAAEMLLEAAILENRSARQSVRP